MVTEGITAVERADGRFYPIDGEEYPSVTTIIGIVRDSKALERWRGDIGNEQADFIVDEAGALGTAVHAGAALYHAQHFGLHSDTHSMDAAHVDWLLELTGQRDVAIDMLNSYLEWMLVNIVEVHMIEQVVYSKPLKYAGRLDLYCQFKGHHRPSVVDLKTGRYLGRKIGMQLAAYGRAGKEMGAMGDYTRYVIKIDKDPPYRVSLVGPYDHEPAQYAAFLNALGLWRFCQS